MQKRTRLKKGHPKHTVFRQLVVGLRADDLDMKQLQYIRFFTKRIPVKAAHFLHIATQQEIEYLQSKQNASIFSPDYQTHSTLLQKMVRNIEDSVLPGSDIDISCTIFTGNILDELQSVIAQREADLIVLGSKQDAKSSHLLELELLHKTFAPILLIPDEAPLKLEKIIVPIDFSSQSLKALRMAIRLSTALNNNVKIIGLHLTEDLSETINYREGSANKIRNALRLEEEQDIRVFLSNFSEQEVERISIKNIKSGHQQAAHNVMDFAKEEDADFVILSGDRFSAIDLIKMSGLTEQMLEVNDCIPSLIV